jgi:hypothetical protein
MANTKNTLQDRIAAAKAKIKELLTLYKRVRQEKIQEFDFQKKSEIDPPCLFEFKITDSVPEFNVQTNCWTATRTIERCMNFVVTDPNTTVIEWGYIHYTDLSQNQKPIGIPKGVLSDLEQGFITDPKYKDMQDTNTIAIGLRKPTAPGAKESRFRNSTKKLVWCIDIVSIPPIFHSDGAQIKCGLMLWDNRGNSYHGDTDTTRVMIDNMVEVKQFYQTAQEYNKKKVLVKIGFVELGDEALLEDFLQKTLVPTLNSMGAISIEIVKNTSVMGTAKGIFKIELHFVD